jgi:1-acyl-sn-glycerol-3-phosphate acyltransferase
MKYWAGKLWLRLFSWQVIGETNLPPKFVLIAAPHTSNWDLPFMLATSYALRVRICWLGKHTLFTGPMGSLLRRLGGVPINRSSKQNMVEQIVDIFSRLDNFVLAVSPEGSRDKVGCWKSGFYYIAQHAGVPIGLGYLDYRRRRCGVGGFMQPTGNLRADMNSVRNFYKDIQGKFPAKQSIPRLREGDDEFSLEN